MSILSKNSGSNGKAGKLYKKEILPQAVITVQVRFLVYVCSCLLFVDQSADQVNGILRNCRPIVAQLNPFKSVYIGKDRCKSKSKKTKEKQPRQWFCQGCPCGAPDWNRTSGLQSRSLTLYPTELQTHILNFILLDTQLDRAFIVTAALRLRQLSYKRIYLILSSQTLSWTERLLLQQPCGCAN